MIIATPKSKPSFFSGLKRNILFALFFGGMLAAAYYLLWGQHLYLVTAYCDCPICINVKAHQDSRFASGQPVYWGGAAADRGISFGSKLELLPHWPPDWLSVFGLLKGKRDFIVEDRGGMIKGKHVDLFIPDKLGGHEAAKNWGVRRMRIKLNGRLAK